MVKLLTKHGNSYALIIDRPIMELLKINPDTPLDISTDGTVLTVRPADRSARSRRLKEAVDRVNAQYGNMMKKLAE